MLLHTSHSDGKIIDARSWVQGGYSTPVTHKILVPILNSLYYQVPLTYASLHQFMNTRSTYDTTSHKQVIKLLHLETVVCKIDIYETSLNNLPFCPKRFPSQGMTDAPKCFKKSCMVSFQSLSCSLLLDSFSVTSLLFPWLLLYISASRLLFFAYFILLHLLFSSVFLAFISFFI